MAWLIVFLRDHFTGWQEVWLLTHLAVYLLLAWLAWKLAVKLESLLWQRITAVVAYSWATLLVFSIAIFVAWEGVNFTYHGIEGPWLGKRQVVSRYNVRVYGDVPAWQLAVIGWALNCPRREVVRPKTVRLFPETSYVSVAAFPNVGRDDKVVAHAHNACGGPAICGISERFNVLLLWHELAHTHCRYLPKRAFDEWRAISGAFPYGYRKYGINDKSFPRDGVMSGYGGFTIDEDIAEWATRIYARLYLGYPISIRQRDDRFLLKLQWFLKWKFITQDEYNVLEPSLR